MDEFEENYDDEILDDAHVEDDEVSDEEIAAIIRQHRMKKWLEDLSGPTVSLIINIIILLIMFLFIVKKYIPVEEKVEVSIEEEVQKDIPEKVTEDQEKNVDMDLELDEKKMSLLGTQELKKLWITFPHILNNMVSSKTFGSRKSFFFDYPVETVINSYAGFPK